MGTGAQRLPIRWHVDGRQCSHSNEDVCPTCDFDSYYATNYPDCPWRDDTEDEF